MNKNLGNLFKGDKVIWMVFFFLCIISVVEVYSASSQLTYKAGNYMAPVIKHIGILLLGIAAMIVTLNVKCKYFKILTPFLLILSVLMLIWALVGTLLRFLRQDIRRNQEVAGIHMDRGSV